MRPVYALLVMCLIPLGLLVADENLDEAQAVAKLELFGGEIERAENLPDRPVTALRFRKEQRFNGRFAALLQPLQHLKRLEMPGVEIGDAALKVIGGVDSLTELTLPHTQISDAGLNELRGLKNLRRLDVSYNLAITDAGLKAIGDLQNLVWLDLSNNSRITDAGMKELTRCKNLKWLSVQQTQVRGAGVLEVQRRLPQLDVEWTRPSGAFGGGKAIAIMNGKEVMFDVPAQAGEKPDPFDLLLKPAPRFGGLKPANPANTLRKVEIPRVLAVPKENDRKLKTLDSFVP